MLRNSFRKEYVALDASAALLDSIERDIVLGDFGRRLDEKVSFDLTTTALTILTRSSAMARGSLRRRYEFIPATGSIIIFESAVDTSGSRRTTDHVALRSVTKFDVQIDVQKSLITVRIVLRNGVDVYRQLRLA
jgi:hypothetical protein